jgi:hypothetical protein
MNKVFLIFLILFSFSVKGQTSNYLIGKWKYKDINNGKTLDSTKQTMLIEVFGDLEFDLKADKSYTAFFAEKEEGTWRYDDNDKTLTLISEKGENKITIINATDKNLILELSKGKELILEKGLKK